MKTDIQNVVAVFVHLSLASVIGFNVAIVTSAFVEKRGLFACHSCLAAATMLTGPVARPIKTATLVTPAHR
jgi:hypothetical protein